MIRSDYAEDFNIARMDLENGVEQIKNRYINACHHLDSQLGRLYRQLEESDLLENTIVIVTGDHGEEFMEKGRRGHNSEFHEEQIRVPLVMRIPGRAPAVYTHMTRHIDIPTTLLRYLGVTNDLADFTLGRSLFETTAPPYSVVSSWDTVGVIAGDVKIRLPSARSAMLARLTGRNDEPLEDEAEQRSRLQATLLEVLEDLSAFRARRGRD